MPKTNLYETCYALYRKGGQDAVFTFINAEHPEVSWRWCEPCEIDSPANPIDQVCLVCGTPTILTDEQVADIY